MENNIFSSFSFSAAVAPSQHPRRLGRNGRNPPPGGTTIIKELEENITDDDIKPQTVASNRDRAVGHTDKPFLHDFSPTPKCGEMVDCSDEGGDPRHYNPSTPQHFSVERSRRKLTAKKEQFDPGATVEGSSGFVKTETKLEIEESDQLICRSSVKVESFPKALKVRQSRSKANGSPEVSAPENWEHIVEEIRSMRIDKDAPVDLFGTHQLLDVEANKETQQFQALVAAMISTQTRDAVTGAAMQRLRAMPGGLNISQIASDAIEVDALAEILKPVGFYRQKAKFMKSIAQTLSAPPHNGTVPNSLEELMKLPGVGPKVALLVLWVAFGMGEEGLIVDTNVRRVCSRLGWVLTNATPELTRRTLESWLPRTLWADISFLFVGFGQQICKPMAPKCESCKVSQLCPSAFKPSPKKPTRKPK